MSCGLARPSAFVRSARVSLLLAAVVRIERSVDGGWRSSCVSCGSIVLFWYDPERQEWRDGRMTRVSSYGPVRFAYELAADDV